MWAVARRPNWIAALLLALGVAAAFAALGQWQLERSIDTGTVIERDTETVMPLTSVAQPQASVSGAADGQLVAVTGRLLDGEYLTIADRVNGGESGYWVVGHLQTPDAAGLAVALGWTADRDTADAVAAGLGAEEVQLTGRYVAGEGPQESDFESGELATVSPGALINLWPTVDPGGVYGGYVVAADPVAGLEAIDSPVPSTEVQVNWLNVFYAAEWVIFAGFAVFLWWRVVRDEFEREEAERAALAEESPNAPPAAQLTGSTDERPEQAE